MRFDKVLSVLYPQCCLFCGAPIYDGYACKNCAENAKPIVGSICSRCGAEKDKCVCSAIINHYDRSVSALYYNEVGKGLVARCKNGEHEASADLAANFMASAFKRYYGGARVDVVTCVPRDLLKNIAHYNHSDILAQKTARILKLPYCHNILLKIRKGFKQKSLTKLERLQNIYGAYKVFRRNKVAGKNILLIDDVKTTGATLNECARALKSAGAVKVYCLTLALTEKRQI